MATAKRIYLYGGAYDTVGDAEEDLRHVAELRKQKHIGRYDAVVVSKAEDGSVHVDDVEASVRATGARNGALAGGALMMLFPPTVLVGAAAGAVAGAVANNLNKRVGRSDAEELASLLDSGETGLLVVAEDVDDAYGGAVLRRAKRWNAIATEADADIVAAALEAADRG